MSHEPSGDTDNIMGYDKLENIEKKIRDSNGLTKLFLDYDGTLVNITSQPELAVPSASLINLLREAEERIPLFLVTGRGLQDMISLVGTGFNIIAMHGSQFMNKGGEKKQTNGFDTYVKRTEELSKKYSHLKDKYEGLRIMDKGGGLQFHYFNVKKDLVDILKSQILEIREDGFEMYKGKFVFELRIKGVNKGKAISEFINGEDFILFAGDDNTDEEAFNMLKDHVTVKVGGGVTNADFRLGSPDDVMILISKITREKGLIREGKE